MSLTPDEAYELLVEHGINVVYCRLAMYKAAQAMLKVHDYLNTIPEIHRISVDDQFTAFKASCTAVGVTIEHPALFDEREAFEARTVSPAVLKLFDQLDDAPLN